jgi:hypothetical protein
MFGVGSLASYENFEQVGEGTYGYVFKANASDPARGSVPVALKKMIFQHKETIGFPIW